MTKRYEVWFGVRDSGLFVFAGIVQTAVDGRFDQFAFLTCTPSTVAGAIHPKAMPVILHDAAKDAWLTGGVAEALAMPLAGDLQRVVSTGP